MGRIRGDLLERSFDFALAVVDLSDHLPENNKGWVLGKQMLRSGTSVSANLHEADAARTIKEFVSICNIAQRECAETRYWLRLCLHAHLLGEEYTSALINEAEELRRILCTICVKSSAHND